jgi:rhamnose transport system ATP-binding protein
MNSCRISFGRADSRFESAPSEADGGTDRKQLLLRLEAHFDARNPVRSLSIADQQLVEIALEISMQTRLLVMDEPTAALSAREVEDLFTIVHQMRSQQVAILFISHRLEQITDIADRVTVLRAGSQILTRPISELTLPDNSGPRRL